MLRPDSRGHRSYFEAFARRRNLTPEVLSTERLLTDRDAYLNFLEVQLERVSVACLAVQECSAKIDGFAARASSAENKVLSATKLVRLAQRYSEEQGHEQARINDAFEDRLADLERRIVDLRDAQPPETGCRSPHEEFAYSSSRHRPPQPDFPVSPEIPTISAVGLSDWMRGVDERLDDLFARRAASPREVRACTDGSETSEEIFPVRGVRTIGDEEGEQERPEEEKAATSPPRLHVEQPPAPDLVRLEERLRRLEEDANAVAAAAASPDGDEAGQNSKDGPHSGKEPGLREAPQSDGGKRAQSCSELGRQDSRLSGIHSPRRSSVPSPLQSFSPEQPSAVDVATGEESCPDAIVKAVEEGTAESRRARELAEEALRVGRETAARSERIENFAKSLAAESLKLAEEQRGKVNEALCRLSSRGWCSGNQECQRSLAAEAWAPERWDNASQEAVVGQRQSPCRPAGGNGGATAVPGEGMDSEGASAAGGGPANGRLNRTDGHERGRGRRASTEVALDARQFRDDPSPVADRRVRSSSRAGADERREYLNRYSVRDIRSILERMPADSVNGRRVAIGAARAALESILREVSPEQEEYEVKAADEGNTRGLPSRARGAGGSSDPREGDGIRGRVQKTAKSVAGRSRSPLSRMKQRLPSRDTRRGSRNGARSSRSRDRVKIPSARDRSRSKHVGAYWIPPGNIPFRIGERRGGLVNARSPWDRREDEVEGEKMAAGR